MRMKEASPAVLTASGCARRQRSRERHWEKRWLPTLRNEEGTPCRDRASANPFENGGQSESGSMQNVVMSWIQKMAEEGCLLNTEARIQLPMVSHRGPMRRKRKTTNRKASAIIPMA